MSFSAENKSVQCNSLSWYFRRGYLWQSRMQARALPHRRFYVFVLKWWETERCSSLLPTTPFSKRGDILNTFSWETAKEISTNMLFHVNDVTIFAPHCACLFCMYHWWWCVLDWLRSSQIKCFTYLFLSCYPHRSTGSRSHQSGCAGGNLVASMLAPGLSSICTLYCTINTTIMSKAAGIHSDSNIALFPFHYKTKHFLVVPSSVCATFCVKGAYGACSMLSVAMAVNVKHS